MARIYLAARYSRHPEMQGVAADLRDLGHEVTSRWILGDHELTGVEAPEEAIQRGIDFAREDLEGLEFADWLISFTEDPKGPKTGRGRGGRHVEYGVALARGHRLIVVGHRENVFHWGMRVVFFPTWEAARMALREEDPDHA
jgi:hypothetical protein